MTPLSEARKEFMAKWIKLGAILFNKAEGYGIDWRKMPIEQVSAAVILHEEWSRPPEYQNNPFANQPLERNHHG